MAAIEAMALGVPLVSSDRHGINDYSIEGVTGYKCHPADYETMAKSIDRILSDEELRLEFSENCKEIAKQFSLEESVATMKTIYKETLGE